jgi:TIR domain-containing protein
MGYVPGYANELFLSYAHADDRDWVAVFEQNLRETLGRELGQKVSVWRDETNIRVAEDWKQDIEDAIRASAAFLTIISPSYKASGWCVKERNFFLQQFCNPTQMAEPEMPCLDRMKFGSVFRFFKIIKAPWPEGKHEKFLKRLQHASFCSGQDDYVEYAAGTEDFRRQVRRTATALADLLRRMRSQLEKVFVACPAPDVEDTCVKLRQDLHDHDYNVRPIGISELDFTLKDLLPDEMDGAVVAVFLLGAAYDPFVQFQLSEASARGVRPLIWIRPDARAKAGEDQRKLIESVSILDNLPQSTCLLPGANEREMIDHVRSLLRLPARTPEAVTAAPSGGVYVICDPSDREDRALAEKWRGKIEDQEGLDVYLPSRKGHAERHEELLRMCDGLLLLQNSAPATWLKENARDVSLAERLYQRPPIRSKCFLIGDTRAFANYGVNLVSDPQQVDLSRLEPFLAPLREAAGTADARH